MSEIVNLRRVRKARVRLAEAAQAAQNRAVHGRTAAERDLERKLAEQGERRLDLLKRDDS